MGLVLLTGFEPFDRFEVNPSWEAAWRVEQQLPGRVVSVRLPVDYEVARKVLTQSLRIHRPMACLCMGLTPERQFQIELVARRPPAFIHLPGSQRLMGVWPWEEIEAAMGLLAAPFCRSADAGGFVCEATYWSLLAFRRATGFPEHAAFLHVPVVSEQFTLGFVTSVVERIVLTRLGSVERPAGCGRLESKPWQGRRGRARASDLRIRSPEVAM